MDASSILAISTQSGLKTCFSSRFFIFVLFLPFYSQFFRSIQQICGCSLSCIIGSNCPHHLATKRFACPLLSRPSRSLRGGVATVGGLLSAASRFPRSPENHCSYRVPSVWGNRSKQLAFVFLPPPCNRGSGILTTDLLLWLPLCSATPCGSRHLLLSEAGQWAAKKCKDTAVGRRLPKNQNARVVQSASGFASRALAFRFFPP